VGRGRVGRENERGIERERSIRQTFFFFGVHGGHNF